MRTSRFKTIGMYCPACPLVVEWMVEGIPGVTCVRSDLETGVTEVSYDPASVTPDDVAAAIDSLKYEAVYIDEKPGSSYRSAAS